jgi:hypothetical protein
VRLGAWLIGRRRITEDQLQRALQHQSFFGGRLGTSLIKLGYIDEDILGAYLSDVAGTPYAPPSRLEDIPPEVIALVPARLAAQYRVVPIGVEGRRLRLAMRDPKDLIALDEIAFLTGMSIEPYVATDFRIQKALHRYFQVSAGTQPLPVATPAKQPAATPATTAPASPAEPVPGTPPDIGLDGRPLDTDDDPALAGVAGAPSSLEQWRMAQDEIPEDLPEAEPAWSAPPAASSKPGGVAAAAAEPRPEVLTEVLTETRLEPRPRPLPPPRPAGVPASSRPASLPGTAAGDGSNLEAAALRLQRAETRDDVFAVMLDFMAARFQRTALFIVQGDRVLGWSGRGDGLDPARIRQVVVSLDRPSIFSFFRSGTDEYEGPIPDQPANTRFFLDLGFPAPAKALLLPLRIKDRPAVILYADNAADSRPVADLAGLRRLVAKAALALEILILKTKILTL